MPYGGKWKLSLSDADSSETVSNCSYCYILEEYIAVGLAADQILIKINKKLEPFHPLS